MDELYIPGFSPHEFRQPTTEREKRAQEATFAADIDAYNFFENGDTVQFNVRTPSESGGVWVTRESLGVRDLDHLSIAALVIILQRPQTNLKCEPAPGDK